MGTERRTQEVLKFVHSIALISEPDEHTAYLIADVDEVPHLSAAEMARGEIFVTGDKDLRAVRTKGRVRIISPRAHPED